MQRERERDVRRQRHHQSDRSWPVCVHLVVGNGTCVWCDFSHTLYKCSLRHADCRTEIKNGGHRTKCCTMPGQRLVVFAAEIRSFLMVTILIR